MNDQRKVVSAWKTGGYGTTMWHHELDCGHVFSRRKRLPAGNVLPRCEECLEEEAGRSMIGQLPEAEAPEPSGHAPEVSEPAQPDRLAGQLQAVSMAAAVIAASIGVPNDQVSIHVDDDGSVAGGTVVLAPSDIEKMLRGLTK